MQISLKEGTNIDMDQVIELYFAVNFLHSREKKQAYKRTIKRAFQNSQYVVSAWEGRKLVGIASVLTDTAIFATIWNLAVYPAYQRKGIGSAMLKACLQRYPTLHFYLFANNKTDKFYLRKGFKKHSFGMFVPKRME